MERNPSPWHTTYRQFISSALRTSICITAKWLCCCIHTRGIRSKTERILNLMTEEFFKKYKFCGSVNHIKVNECLSESSNSPAHSPSLFGNLPSKVFPSQGDTARDSWDTTAMESPPQQSEHAEGRPYRNHSPLSTHFSSICTKKGASITCPAVVWGDIRKTSISRCISFNCQ